MHRGCSVSTRRHYLSEVKTRQEEEFRGACSELNSELAVWTKRRGYLVVPTTMCELVLLAVDTSLQFALFGPKWSPGLVVTLLGKSV